MTPVSVSTPAAASFSDRPPASELTAFVGFRRIATGPRTEVLAQLRQRTKRGASASASASASVFVFDDHTGEQIDLDLRPDTPASYDVPHAQQPARAVGRPKLGVIAREVTLLPRHWDWLGCQPGGASVALRRLVEEARRVNVDRDTTRVARDATYRFMSAIAGDLAGFEEAARALFAGDAERFGSVITAWPTDLRTHLQKMSAAAWGAL